MAERSTIAQRVQVGVETTPGTAVAASKNLLALSIELAVGSDSHMFKPRGAKYNTIIYNGKEWADADVSGDATYSELQYLFASLVGTPTVAQLMDSATPTAAYKWTFVSNTFGADSFKTYTVEQGDGTYAHRSANFVITGATIEFSRDEVTIDGEGYGAAIETGITLTASPTSIDTVPVQPTQLSVYLDTSAANLGNTKQLRVLSGEWTLEDRFAALFVVDAAKPSYVAHVEQEPNFEFKLKVEADTQGMAYLTAFRASATQFMRLEGIGPKIYTGATTPADVYHRLTVDSAGKISEIDKFDDEDGVYAVEFTWTGVHDATWGKAMQIELVNKATAL